ncbi:PIN-like domain-containing protein [Streptomyces sp. NPDC101175]|uniref:PIN-like domain-containing protein n=1 Tax=Streptomyces sp. NPDC101175 TaxID=3366123 RepID=UPI003832A51A
MANEDTNQDSEPDDVEEQGIFDGFSGYITPTVDDWKSVVSDGLIVVDTNVLLNLYRYNHGARSSLLATLGAFGNRLWVPHQVMNEFWRNRDSALEDPERQLQQSITALKADLDKSFSDLRQWVNRVSLDRKSAQRLESVLSIALDDVITEMEAVVGNGDGMDRDTSKDEVVLALARILKGKVGRALTSDNYSAALIEGKRRIDEQIPPGYKDKKKQSQGDDSEVGDYLVWAQLIHEAKRRERSVLLVTGDAKEDWWRTRNGISLGPRNELTEELLREAGVRLYMLKPDRLLTYARDFLRVTVSDDSVQNVEIVDAQSAFDEEFFELSRLAESDATAATIAAWHKVEQTLGKVLSYDPSEHRRLSPGRLIGAAAQQRLLSRDLMADARQLYETRSRVAHASEPIMTQESALSYLSMARKVVDALTLASTLQSQALRFESSMEDLLVNSGFTVERVIADSGYDFHVRRPESGSSMALNLKFYGSGRPYIMQSLEQERRKLESLPVDFISLLVVTNSPLTSAVRAAISQPSPDEIDSSSGPRSLEVVQWTGPEDDGAVVGAARRMT